MNLTRVFGRASCVAMAPVFKQYWLEMHPGLNDSQSMRLEGRLLLKFVDEARHIMVATDKDGIHGFVVVTPGASDRDGHLVALLEEIWVSPTSRGTTETVKVLYSGATRIAKESGCRWVDANVSMHNHHVSAMLLKRRFTPERTLYTRDLEAKKWDNPTPTKKQKRSTSSPNPKVSKVVGASKSL